MGKMGTAQREVHGKAIMRCLTLFLCSIFLLPPALAATFYVDQANPSCSDTDPSAGTQGMPWCTVAKAASSASVNPGDTVLVSNGIYRGAVTFTRSGTSGNPVTYRANGDSVVITLGQPLNEALFVPTPGYPNVYEIRQDQLPASMLYQGALDNCSLSRYQLVQLDGSSTWSGYRAGAFDGALAQNPFQCERSVAEVGATPASWFVDTGISPRKLYVRTRDGTAPAGHELEATVPNAEVSFQGGVSNVVVGGFTFRHARVVIGASTNVVVQDFESIGSGVSIGSGAANARLNNCYIHDGLPGTSGQYGGGLGVTSSTGASITNCTVEKFWNNVQMDGNTDTAFDRFLSRDCPNHGFDSNLVRGLTVTNSVFLRCQDFFYLRGGQDITIHNSLFPGLGLHRYLAQGCEIPANIELKNNILHGINKDALNCSSYTWSQVSLDSDYNYFLPADDNIQGNGEDWLFQRGQFEIGSSTLYTLSQWRTDTGQDLNSRTCNSNPAASTCPTPAPLWQDVQNDDFHPVSNSQLIDVGTAVSNDHDYDLNSRPQGTAYDIGPHEQATSGGQQSFGPLRKSTVNPRYFTDNRGIAIFLAGSHTWDNRQDGYVPLDYTGYLDFLEGLHHNFFRFWVWEQAKGISDVSDPPHANAFLLPTIYQRTGPGTAADGQPKFDLTQFNQAHFDRLRQRVVEAGDRGMYVSVMLWNGWSTQNKGGGVNPWLYHPFNANNNINGINGDPNGDGAGDEIHTLANPTIVALQEAYARKVMDTVNDLDNVLYEICNECNPNSKTWEYHLIDYVRAYEAGLSNQHPVGMTFEYSGGSNADLFASNADWISPNSEGGYITDPPAADGSKIIVSDTDHLWGIGGNYGWAWKSFTRGMNLLYMDIYLGGWMPGNPDALLRANLGYIRDYATRMNLISMTPQNALCGTGYCLANPSPAGEYLVFLPSAGTTTVNLAATPGTITVEWFNPATGQPTAGGTLQGGATRSFTAPFGGSAVLYLYTPGASGQAPVADFSMNPSSGMAPLTVQFTDLSYDPDGSIVAWEWDLDNDGLTDDSFVQNPTWAFTVGTTYNIILKVTDNTDLTGTITKPLTVSAPGQRAPVLAPIGDKSVDVGMLLEFTITATDADGDALTFLTPYNLPVGATFVDNHDNTALFSWTPNAGQAGPNPVHFEVTDGSGSVTDDFERASLGSSWTVSRGTPQIYGSSDLGGGSAGENSAYWNADLFSDDQYSEVLISAISSSSVADPVVRRSMSGPENAYILEVEGTAGTIYKRIGGSDSAVAGSSFTVLGGLLVGDRLRLEAEGTTLRAYRNGNLVVTATDTSIASGSPGILLWASGVPVSRVESWSAGGVTGGLSDYEDITITVNPVDCHDADTDCDGTISSGELSAYISSWFSGSISISDVIDAIEMWKAQ